MFEHLLLKPVWTLKEAAQITGRILQFKLIWGAEASLLARPIYHDLASNLRENDENWRRTSFSPLPLHGRCLVFAWVPRDKNQVADKLSKTHGYCICPQVFARLHEEHNFTLDGFAAPHHHMKESVSTFLSAPGLFTRMHWDRRRWSIGHTEWCGQCHPPNTKMISLALRKSFATAHQSPFPV